MVGKRLLFALAALAAVGTGSRLAAQPMDFRMGPLETYRNDRFGFVLRYPAAVFEPAEQQGSEDGRVFVTRDRDARLIASAGINSAEETLLSYRKFVMERTYQGAAYDYTPLRRTWFVLSGTMGDKMFYERITFVCDGRVIYGWQMTYPVARRAFFDRVVEAVHRHYRPGRGQGDSCE